MGTKYCDVYVCLLLYVSVRLLIPETTRLNFTKFCACWVYPLLNPSLLALRYYILPVFRMTSCFHIMGASCIFRIGYSLFLVGYSRKYCIASIQILVNDKDLSTYSSVIMGNWASGAKSDISMSALLWICCTSVYCTKSTSSCHDLLLQICCWLIVHVFLDADHAFWVASCLFWFILA